MQQNVFFLSTVGFQIIQPHAVLIPRWAGGEWSMWRDFSPRANPLSSAMFQGLCPQWLDSLVNLLPDLLQQDHRGKTNEDAFDTGLQRRRRWLAHCSALLICFACLFACFCLPCTGYKLSVCLHIRFVSMGVCVCLSLQSCCVMLKHVVCFLTVTAMVVAWITVMEGKSRNQIDCL